MMLSKILAWSGVLFGIASAYYWYLTSIVKVTKETPVHKGKPRYDLGDDVIVKGKTIEIPLLATAIETSRLNKIAALLTAASILCQALATALS